MPCAGHKDTYPDLQTALVVRDELIKRYAVPMLAYKCLGGCRMWHLTTQKKYGKRVRQWNNIDTAEGIIDYWRMVRDAGWNPVPYIITIQVPEEYL